MSIDPQIWLDKVRAVPVVGIRLNPTFEAASTLLDHVRPVLTKWNKDYGELKVSVHKDFVLKVERPDGYELTLAHDAITCKFFYLSTLKEKGERQPVISYQTNTQPIDVLTSGAIQVVEEVAAEFWKGGNRLLHRIGVVATGSIDYDEMPPGFELLVTHLSQPWKVKPTTFAFKLLAQLLKKGDQVDRCHHDISWDGEDDSSVSYAIDWQRVFEEGKSMPLSKLRDEIEQAKVAGFNYFGDFGLGKLCYANGEG